MPGSVQRRMMPFLVLHARTATDLMTPDPKSLRQDAPVAEAAAFLGTRGFSAAPVVDDAGQPVGVVSRTDLLHHYGQKPVRLLVAPVGGESVRAGIEERARVREVMTPAVLCVHADTPAAKVVEKMVTTRSRRLFVVDDDGTLVGVVSAFDVLRGLGGPFRVAAKDA